MLGGRLAVLARDAGRMGDPGGCGIVRAVGEDVGPRVVDGVLGSISDEILASGELCCSGGGGLCASNFDRLDGPASDIADPFLGRLGGDGYTRPCGIGSTVVPSSSPIGAESSTSPAASGSTVMRRELGRRLVVEEGDIDDVQSSTSSM